MSGSCGASVMQEVVRCVDEQTPNHVKSFVVAGIGEKRQDVVQNI